MRKIRIASHFCIWSALFACLALWAPHSPSADSREALRDQSQFPLAATLAINEYLADPADGLAGDANGDGTRDATQDEFVELVNTGATPLNIGGFTISDAASVRFTVPAGKVIPPGEAAVVFGGGTPTGPFGNATSNGLVFAAGGSGLSLNNGGDTITVKDNTSVIVASVTYGSSEGNANQSITRSPDVTGSFVPHSTAPGSGGRIYSPGTRLNGAPFTTTDPIITAISPAAVVAGSGAFTLDVTGSNFQSGAQVRVDGNAINTMFISTDQLSAEVPSSLTSSPGSRAITVQNPGGAVSSSVTLVVLPALGINEFMADPPDGIAGDANGDGVRDASQDEFIEIVNRTSSPLNIGGYSVRDADSIRLTFPIGTVIPGNEVAVIFGGGHPTGDFGNAMANGLVFTAVISLNNGGDTITIADNTNSIVEAVSYGGTEGGANQSINRNPEVLGSFVPHSTIPASGGRLFSPGTAVDGSPFTVGPHITSIDPDHVNQTTQPFDLTIEGTGFELSSIAYIDASPVNTGTVGSSLVAQVPALVASTPGSHRVEVRNENGNKSNAVVLTVIPPAPRLTAIIPRVVTVGTPQFTLTAQGLNFDSQTVLLFDGSALTMTFRNAHELRATVPAAKVAAIGSHLIRARNADGQESRDLALDVLPTALRIDSVSPADVVAGGVGLTITVRGSNFKSGATIFFEQAPLVTTFLSSTQLRGEVTADLIAQPGLKAISAQNPDGGPSNQVIFRVVPDRPVIGSLNPDRVPEGSGEVSITIAGEKFQAGAIVRVPTTQPETRLEANFISSREISVKLPSHLFGHAGNVELVVENPDSGVSNTIALKVLIKDALVINEFLADPPDGDTGDANGDGVRSSSQDEFIEIVNRTAEQTDLSSYKLSDADQVRHVFPTGTIVPPFETVVVFGGGQPAGRFGNAAENHLVFKASSGGLSLNNTGDTIRLEDPSGRVVQEIKFGADVGGASQSFNRDPDVDGAAFSLHSVVSGGRSFSPGTRAAGQPFTNKPAISAVSPASLRVGSPGTIISLSGSEFLAGAVVLFGDAQLATIYRSSTLVEADIPKESLAEAGLIQIRVRNPRGELSTPAKFAITDDPPRITKLIPEVVGTGAEHFEVSLLGERFQRGALVAIAGEILETSFVSKTELRAIVPDRLFAAAAELEVRLLNADGNNSNVVKLKVENGPLITRLSRKRIKAGSDDMDFELGGVAFKSDVIVFVGDTAVPTKFNSETSVSVRIPRELIAQPGELVFQARHSDGGRSNRVKVKVVE